MLNGARQVPGARAMAVMKSVGAYVALDGLAIANAARPAAGAAAVVVAGDDPALSSTQVGADSRRHAGGRAHPGARARERAGAEGPRARGLRPVGRERADRRARLHDRRRPTAPASSTCCPTGAPAIGPRSRVALDTAAIRAAESVSLPPQATAPRGRPPRAAASRCLHRAVRAAGLDRIEPAGGAGAAPAGHRDRRRLLRPAARRPRRAGDRRRGADPPPRPHLAGRRRPGAAVRRRRRRGRGDGGALAAPRGPGAPRARGPPPGRVGQAAAGGGPRLPGGRRAWTRTSPWRCSAASCWPGRTRSRPRRRARAREAAERRAELARRALDVDPAHADLLRRLPAPRHELADDRDPPPARRPAAT